MVIQWHNVTFLQEFNMPFLIQVHPGLDGSLEIWIEDVCIASFDTLDEVREYLSELEGDIAAYRMGVDWAT